MSAVVTVLRLPTYQRFLAGAVCNGVGVWIFQTAIYWAALQSGSTGSVGALVAVLSLPSLLLTIPAGYLTDRAGPFWLLLVGAAAPALACIGGIALVSPDGSIALEPAALVTFVVGSAYALWNVPALVYVTRVVPGPVLGTAISMMVLQYATGRIIGGAVGGWLVSVGGAALAFGVSAAVFGAGALVSLSLPRISGLDNRAGNSFRGMAEAVRWLRHAPATLVLVVFGATTSMLAYAYIPLLGALSRDVIHAGASGLGTLTSTSGIGMVASAVTANALGGRLRRGRAVALLLVAGSVSMAALGVSSVLLVSVGLVICVAYIGSGRSSISAYLLQSLTPPRMRGRVTSLADFVGQLMTIVGSVAVGALAVAYGPTAVLVGCSAVIIAVVAVVLLVAPWFLALDVGDDAQAVLRDEPYVEGRPTGAIVEPS